MAKGSKIKDSRNKKLVEMKAKMTFKNLAKVFNLSEARTKEIFYRERKRKSKAK